MYTASYNLGQIENERFKRTHHLLNILVTPIDLPFTAIHGLRAIYTKQSKSSPLNAKAMGISSI